MDVPGSYDTVADEYTRRIADELRHKQDACAAVDAAMITATRPDMTMAAVFQSAVDTYAKEGFANEWRLHHQGGPAGYEPREWMVTPRSHEQIAVGQAFAWSPSITGVKSEDTILVGAQENKALTPTPGLPTLSVQANGHTVMRPAIFEAR